MTGFRKPKKKTMQARALTNPHPRFVSLVQAGANQTPIRSIKVDQPMEDNSMTIAALKADGHEVKRITFTKGDQFPGEDEVRAFLDEGGYDATSLKATDDGFEVVNDTNEFTDDVRVVKVSDDLEIEVGKLVVKEKDEDDADAKADKQANKAGSIITDVAEIDAKKEGAAAEDEAAQKANEDAAVEANDDDATGSEDGAEDATKEGILTAGLDGSLKPIRKRAKPEDAAKQEDATAEVTEDGGDAGSTGAKKEDAIKEDDASSCGPDEVFQDGKCVKTTAKVGDETFKVMLEATDVDGIAVPALSFEVTEKVEVLSGDCGPGHTMMSVGGRSFCVPTGDRAAISQDTEVTAPAAGGGQGNASAGSTPVSGQTQRSEGDEVILRCACIDEGTETKTKEVAAKFDEFAAHFSDGMTLSEVMDDANDGFPPGLELVILAAVTAMRNSFIAGDTEGVRQAGTDLGAVAAMLGGMFETVERAEDKQKLVDRVSGQFADLGWPQAEEDDQTADETAAKAAEGGEAALTTALSELAVTMKSIADSVGEVRKTQQEQAVETTVLTERVEKVESTKQTRKGADEDGTEAAAPAKKSPIADVRLRGALGISQTS